MKLPIKGPVWPEELNIEAEPELGDASMRIPPGIKLTISWLRLDGTEWGMVQYIPKGDLTG